MQALFFCAKLCFFVTKKVDCGKMVSEFDTLEKTPWK